LAARLLVDGWQWVRPRLPARLQGVGLSLAAAALIAWPLAASLFQDYMLLQPDPRVTARAWIEAQVPAGSRVVLDMGGPSLPASAESLLAHQGPPQGRLAELQREVAASHNLSYWVLPIQHFVSGQAYLEGQEATVHTLDWYREQGYEYVVLSTLPYNSYVRWPGIAQRYPLTMAFYHGVAHDGQMLAEFEPTFEDWRDFTNTDLNPIPTIRVYHLSTSSRSGMP
jgi:hypothetical protein